MKAAIRKRSNISLLRQTLTYKGLPLFETYFAGELPFNSQTLEYWNIKDGSKLDLYVDIDALSLDFVCMLERLKAECEIVSAKICVIKFRVFSPDASANQSTKYLLRRLLFAQILTMRLVLILRDGRQISLDVSHDTFVDAEETSAGFELHLRQGAHDPLSPQRFGAASTHSFRTQRSRTEAGRNERTGHVPRHSPLPEDL